MKSLFVIAAFLFFTHSALACSIEIPRISNFDNANYIFIGEVIEVVESVKHKSEKIKADFVGLKIKVTENVYSLKTAVYFDVFPLRLTPGCDSVSDIKKVREHFPIGSQVRVVAKEATFLKDQSGGSSDIMLYTSFDDRGSIARNDLKDNLRTSAKSLYDYGSFVERQRTTAAEDALFDSNYYLPEFELRKDLLRLKEAESESVREKILERLVLYPHVFRLSYLEIARTYLKNQDKLAALEKQWLERLQEILSKRQ